MFAGLAAALAGGEPIAPIPEPRAMLSLGLDHPVTEPDAAVVVSTSGSSSTPKAVVLSAAGIRHAAHAAHARLGGPGDWVCALPTRHVAGLMTVARAVVAGTELRFARSDLSDLPSPSGRCYVSLVAAQLDRALGSAQAAAALAQYSAVLIGGSALPGELRRRAEAAGIRVVATYGMSETCGGCVYDGLPLDGMRVEVAGGRIHLGGPMAFLGYRLRPELTAGVLRGDLVRTDDRGLWQEGRLRVLGRFDDLVITGGAKVDLGDLQHACDSEFGPGVLRMLVLPDSRWGQRIVALTTVDLSLEEVQQRLLKVVGTDALPRELRLAPELPYTSLRKIDRAATLRLWQELGDHGDIH